MKTTYPSAVDTWLAVLLVATPLVGLGAGVFTLSQSIPAGIVQIGLGLFVALLIFAFALPCEYTLDETTLTIRCGLLREEIPLNRIRHVEFSSLRWSAPALSLKRVKLTLDDGTRLISPKDREGFMHALQVKLAPAR